MWEYNYNNELRHYGVLGMKWGVRRKRTTDSSSNSGQSSEKSQRAQARKQTMKNLVIKGSAAIGSARLYFLTDEIFNGGAQKRALVTAGRFAVTAFLRKRGHTNIRWS